MAACPSPHLHFCDFQLLHVGASHRHCLHPVQYSWLNNHLMNLSSFKKNVWWYPVLTLCMVLSIYFNSVTDGLSSSHARTRSITERRLIWYGHVMRRDGEHILRKVLRADIPGKRKRGRPKTRWKDACQRDLKSTGLRAGEETDRAMWRRKIISHTGDPT